MRSDAGNLAGVGADKQPAEERQALAERHLDYFLRLAQTLNETGRAILPAGLAGSNGERTGQLASCPAMVPHRCAARKRLMLAARSGVSGIHVGIRRGDETGSKIICRRGRRRNAAAYSSAAWRGNIAVSRTDIRRPGRFSKPPSHCGDRAADPRGFAASGPARNVAREEQNLRWAELSLCHIRAGRR